MNDRYLFKALRIGWKNLPKEEQWAQGYFIKKHGIPFIYETSECPMNSLEIYESTVCQCTGLKDKNGTMIWENDIVFVTGYSYIEPEFELNGRVTWSLGDSCFEIDGVPIVESKGSYFTEYHVLGNYFDNPELLEV